MTITQINRKSANSLVRNARRVQQNYNGNYEGYYNGNAGGGGGQDMKEAWFLADYSLKMISCLPNEQSVNYERGEVESSTVIFRLCPKDTCTSSDGSDTLGCDSGFGDFAIGINTFVQAYTESVKDNYNSNMQFYSYSYGEFNVEEYTRECKLFEGDEGEGANNNNYNMYNNYSYIGVACTEDGKDIRLASFSDQYCAQESTTSFASSHNGMELPYASGGLVPDTCMNCITTNENYEYEITEMCRSTYEDATSRCEQNMESYNSYYGQDTRGCEYIESKLPSSSTSKNTASGFFRNQPEGLKLAEEYIALLVVAGLVGAGLVFFFTKKAVCKHRSGAGKEQPDGEFQDEPEFTPPSITLSIPPAVSDIAVSVKSAVQDTAAKVVSMAKGPSTAEQTGNYSAMNDVTGVAEA